MNRAAARWTKRYLGARSFNQRFWEVASRTRRITCTSRFYYEAASVQRPRTRCVTKDESSVCSRQIDALKTYLREPISARPRGEPPPCREAFFWHVML